MRAEHLVQDCISRQSRMRPDAVAAHCMGEHLTYAALEAQANALAHYLRARGMQPGSVIGVCLPPSFELLTTLLAIWKAGGVYLPLDIEYPGNRLGQMLENANCQCAVTRSEVSGPLQDRVATIVYLDAEQAGITQMPDTEPACETSSEDMACLLYTSGSTGTPKGVMIPHRALVNKLVTPGTWGEVTAECRSVLLSSVAFDASLAQMLLPLAHGGCVVIPAERERLSPTHIWPLLRAQRVNILDCTPSWLMAMLEAAPAELSLQRVVLGGEVLTPEFARRVCARFAQAQVVNIYGPTEACIDAAAHLVNAADCIAERVPIGTALPGYRLYVLDEQQQPCKPGQSGQLYIAGAGLALGYWSNESATKHCFVADPWMPGERMYRTGDLVQRRADGIIEFLGRADQQIKLRGQRVELGDIETALATLPGVMAAAVKAWPGADGAVATLTGYVVMSTPGANLHALREQLRQQLPAHMVPAAIVQLDAFPLSATGKIDRAVLPVAATRVGRQVEHLPRDPAETQLVRIWCEVLKLDAVDIHDNFFELGGHSLLAVELLLRINRHFDVELPATVLLSHPTVADLALALLRDTSVAPARVITLAGAQATHTPLFMLPPRSGMGLVYAGLARELAKVVPVLALQAVGLSHAPPGSANMQQLASELADEIQRVQRHGPIALCGYSAGGAIAYELTRCLQQAGRVVSHLILLDPYCADYADWPDSPPMPQGEQAFWSVCRDMIGDALSLRGPAAEPVLVMSKKLWNEVLRSDVDRNAPQVHALLEQARTVLPATMDVNLYLLLLEAVGNLWHAFAGQSLTPLDHFAGRVLFIQPDADPSSFRQQRVDYWQTLLGAVMQTHVVPGEHMSMLYRAHTVAAIGEQLRSFLDESHGENTSHERTRRRA